ncbi:MAG: NERD domain-containing protein [Gammaproteobacteria bacterium]|nr:NERD domain-containing protein [Gammaproteobacteria bacterium]
MYSSSFIFYIGLVSGLLLAGGFFLWWKKRNSFHGRLSRVLRKIGADSLNDIVIPDGVDGEIQIDQLLLTDKGLLILDVREISGRLYAGENMDEWAVINHSQRFTFTNPVGPLRERVIAVKSLLPDVPVQGRVVVIGTAALPGGLPQCVVDLAMLGDQFSPDDKSARDKTNAFYPHWDRLRQIATPV